MKGVIRKGSKAETKLRNISDDLQKKISTGRLGKLKQADILTAIQIGKEIVIKGLSATINKNVAEYFKTFGFMVTLDFNKINYVIVV